MDTKLQDMVVTLTLKDGSLHLPEDENTQTVSFRQYVINIPLQPSASAPNYRSRRTMTMTELLRSADRGLDEAKRHGKDSIVLAGEAPGDAAPPD